MLERDAQRRLAGSLVGLARALESQPEDAAALALLRESLCLLPTGDDAALTAQAERVRAAKRAAAPDCARCAAPCGRTADLPPEAVDAARFAPAIAQARAGQIERLVELVFFAGYDI